MVRINCYESAQVAADSVYENDRLWQNEIAASSKFAHSNNGESTAIKAVDQASGDFLQIWFF